jgi:hypothetical protein
VDYIAGVEDATLLQQVGIKPLLDKQHFVLVAQQGFERSITVAAGLMGRVDVTRLTPQVVLCCTSDSEAAQLGEVGTRSVFGNRERKTSMGVGCSWSKGSLLCCMV